VIARRLQRGNLLMLFYY